MNYEDHCKTGRKDDVETVREKEIEKTDIQDWTISLVLNTLKYRRYTGRGHPAKLRKGYSAMSIVEQEIRVSFVSFCRTSAPHDGFDRCLGIDLASTKNLINLRRDCPRRPAVKFCIAGSREEVTEIFCSQDISDISIARRTRRT